LVNELVEARQHNAVKRVLARCARRRTWFVSTIGSAERKRSVLANAGITLRWLVLRRALGELPPVLFLVRRVFGRGRVKIDDRAAF